MRLQSFACCLDWTCQRGCVPLFQGLNCFSQLQDGIMDLLQFHCVGLAGLGCGCGVTLAQKLFDDRVGKEGDKMQLYFCFSSVRFCYNNVI